MVDFRDLRQTESSFESYTPKSGSSIVIIDLPHKVVQIRNVDPSPHCLFSRTAGKGSDVLSDWLWPSGRVVVILM
jgi:hypothetical protein